MSRIERGKARPPLDTLETLASGLKVPVRTMFEVQGFTRPMRGSRLPIAAYGPHFIGGIRDHRRRTSTYVGTWPEGDRDMPAWRERNQTARTSLSSRGTAAQHTTECEKLIHSVHSN